MAEQIGGYCASPSSYAATVGEGGRDACGAGQSRDRELPGEVAHPAWLVQAGHLTVPGAGLFVSCLGRQDLAGALACSVRLLREVQGQGGEQVLLLVRDLHVRVVSAAGQGLAKTRLAVDAQAGPWVTQIFEWQVYENLSREAIALRLDAAGAPSPDGDGWHPAAVGLILANPKYTATWCTAGPATPARASAKSAPYRAASGCGRRSRPTPPWCPGAGEAAQQIGAAHEGVRDPKVPYAPGFLATAPDPVREYLYAALGVECLYRPAIKQVTIRATITSTMPGIIAALLADSRTSDDNATGTAAISIPVAGTPCSRSGTRQPRNCET